MRLFSIMSAIIASIGLFSGVPLAGIAHVEAGDVWPEFRGPTADGHSDAKGLPTTWGESENIRWKTAIHGKGWSSPVVWGQQIWMTTAPVDGKTMHAICTDLKTGKIIHDIKLWDVAEPQFVIPMNSYASSTPAIEAGRVYVHFGTHGTAALDTKSGEILWKRLDVHCDHHRGAASSPILFENLLIMNFDGFDVQFVIALDKATGKTVWKKDREIHDPQANGDGKKAYATPRIITVDDKPQLINPSAGATVSYNPRTGEEIWRVKSGGMNAASRPLFAHGLIYATTAAGGFQLFATKPDGQGDVSKSHLAWKHNKSVPTRPSPILVDDLIYMISDAGIMSCVEAKTGTPVWLERLGGNYSASPVYADGKIYFFSEDGTTPVIASGREYKLLAKNKLDAGFMASPAIVGKSLILRTKTDLYCVEQK